MEQGGDRCGYLVGTSAGWGGRGNRCRTGASCLHACAPPLGPLLVGTATLILPSCSSSEFPCCASSWFLPSSKEEVAASGLGEEVVVAAPGLCIEVVAVAAPGLEEDN
ncbi:hypothetical protein E2562_010354 [Oryza meyeriana var. granulata]|uniref:Uncharacterized protein n=1 Tax=Oryza meyeriana var. granulata TaxID=110450 RepID=A0A6G1F6H9_9ORYZ|nr:hypothetical protein E2562_010354 [Oryza meyeriana var. granulata]